MVTYIMKRFLSSLLSSAEENAHSYLSFFLRNLRSGWHILLNYDKKDNYLYKLHAISLWWFFLDKKFVEFVKAWKKISDSGEKEMNLSTLDCFLAQNFGIERNKMSHYKSLSFSFGFLTQSKPNVFTINSQAISLLYNSSVTPNDLC